MKRALRAAQHRLKWQMFGRVLILVLILIPLFGLVRYGIDRMSLTRQFERQISGAVEVLSVGLRRPLWELDEPQIGETVKSLSSLPDLLAVRISESRPSRGELVFVRNDQNQLVPLSATTAPQLEAPVQRPFLIRFSNNESAQGMLYFSEENHRATMRDSIVGLSTQLAIFALLIIAAMYYLVQYYVGGPLERLSMAMAPDAAPDLLETTIVVLPNNELRALVERYLHVLKELRGHQDHLTEMVKQRTRALSDANEVLTDEIQRRMHMEQELILAREQADQANEAKTFFLAHMSHELRTPLNGILGYSQLLSTEADLSVSAREIVTNIINCGQHLLQMINCILDLIKIEEGHVERLDEVFSLRQLLTDVVTMVRPAANKKKLALELTGLEDIPAAAVGDAPHLRQVLINLLGNAVKFTEQGKVSLRVAQTGDNRITFVVADTGQGIADRDIGRIFEPFQQSGTSAHQARGGGSGLGLSIAHRLVHLMGGEITVRSLLGEGSEFSFELVVPTADTTALPGEARRIVGIEGPARPHVLIVDDVAFNRDILKRQLEHICFAADTAASAQEALEMVARQLPDIVFMDLRMPDMDGITCAKIIRERAPQLPIVAFTSSVFDADVNASIKTIFDGLVLKPVDLRQACEAIAQCLPVRFTYAAVHEAVALGDGEPEESPVPALSESEVMQLRCWLLSGALASIRGFAETLRERDPALGDRLHSLARAYDIEGLRSLLA